MVAPLDNVRPVGQTPPAAPARPRPAAGVDFAAELQRATEQLAAQGDKAPVQAFDADPLLEIQQATQALQRASSYAQAARAYYRSAQQGSVDSTV
jgi:hypothetical protein